MDAFNTFLGLTAVARTSELGSIKVQSIVIRHHCYRTSGFLIALQVQRRLRTTDQKVEEAMRNICDYELNSDQQGEDGEMKPVLLGRKSIGR